MVSLWRYVYKVSISVFASMDHLLMMLILCAFACQAWNVARTTERTAYELVLATRNRLEVPLTAHHWSPRLLSVFQKVKAVSKASSSASRIKPLSIRDIGGARALRLHEEVVKVAVETLGRGSSTGRIFEGLLATDGSISSVKLLMEEEDQFVAYDPVNHTRRRNNIIKAGKQQRDSSRANGFDKKYPPCAEELRDLLPCLNASEGHLYGRCPNVNRGLGSCVIPAPKLYSRQFKWPESKNQVRWPNVPKVPLLQQYRSSWMRPQGNIIYLGDGDPRFPNGTSEYVLDLAKIIQDLTVGKDIRLVLDIGCGSGNVAAALETYGVLTLSIAGEGSYGNGVQLVVERGYPALVQSLGSLRLPYPSQAFDMIHCAACDVPWEKQENPRENEYTVAALCQWENSQWLSKDLQIPNSSLRGGLKLLEVDRILRPGGIFVWMDPSKVGDHWNGVEELTKKMCWRKVAQRGQNFALWQKPTTETCYLTRRLSSPPLCNATVPPDTSWNVPMQSCLIGFTGTYTAIAHPWPVRLKAPPPRLQETSAGGIEAAKAEAYAADLNYWVFILAFYVVDFGSIRVHEIRNVLDMNAGYGGFAAAVSMKTPPLQWWVLNVIPIDQPDRLAVIFDRGLLGVYHDWCESFDVYPRTFDMIHSSGFFSSTLRFWGSFLSDHGFLEARFFPSMKFFYLDCQCSRWEWPTRAPLHTKDRDAGETVSMCAVSDLVQEMDRLLRPGGFAIIRDQEQILLQIQEITRAMHWKTTVMDTESGPMGKDKLLSCQKTFWILGT